jgi:thioredoxin 2
MDASTASNDTKSNATLKCQFCGTWNRIDAARAADKPKCGKCGKPILLDRPVKLDDESFTRTIAESDVPVLVDFYADWCGPCKMMAPSVDKLAADYSGKAIVAKLDTDMAQRTSQSFQIRGIPTSIVFLKGKEVSRQTGAVPYAALASMIDGASTT